MKKWSVANEYTPRLALPTRLDRNMAKD
jgi:hypothetical protein